VAVSGERLRNAANRLQLPMWPLCVPAHSLRAFMSSIMRWRSELIESVVIDDSCLDEVDHTSIFKTGRHAATDDLSSGNNTRR
jgi:hypothetical protein